MGIRHAIMKAETALPATESFILEETQPLPSNLIAHHFNHFIVKYSQALISFGAQCDQKLLHLQIRINRIENALGLLEKKLEPFGSKEVEEVVTSTTTPTSQEIAEKPSEHELNPGVEEVVENKAIETDEKNVSLNEPEEVKEEKNDGVDDDALKVKDAPELQPFFKMLRMGVPLEAVKLKMSLSGLNPDLLDMPETNYDAGK